MLRLPTRLRRLCLVLPFVAAAATAAQAQGPELVATPLPTGDYAVARDALVEAVEAKGLVLDPPSRFGEMLKRTGPDLGMGASVYEQAEVFHFCSARIAWTLAQEDPRNAAMCPLSIALYALPPQPGKAPTVYATYRAPGDATPGQRQAEALLRAIVADIQANAAP